MKNTEHCRTSNTETVTISVRNTKNFKRRADVSALEQRGYAYGSIAACAHKQFGTSSEKSDEAVAEQLSFLFNEAEVFAQDPQEKLLLWPRTSAAKSTNTRWTAFQREFPPRW